MLSALCFGIHKDHHPSSSSLPFHSKIRVCRLKDTIVYPIQFFPHSQILKLFFKPFLPSLLILFPNHKTMTHQHKESIATSAHSTSSTMTPFKELLNPLDTSPLPHYHDDTSPHVWSRIRHRNQNAFSEFLGTFLFLLFSFGCTAQYVLGEGKKGDYTTLCLGWGYVLCSLCLFYGLALCYLPFGFLGLGPFCFVILLFLSFPSYLGYLYTNNHYSEWESC